MKCVWSPAFLHCLLGACLSCHVKTTRMAPYMSTVPLVLSSFVIIAEAYLITTNVCTREKWCVVGKSPPLASCEYARTRKDVLLTRPGSNCVCGYQIPTLEARLFGGKISPMKFTHRTPAWTAMALQAVQGQGVLFVSCHFWKLDDRGRTPLRRPPTEAVICHAHY